MANIVARTCFGMEIATVCVLLGSTSLTHSLVQESIVEVDLRHGDLLSMVPAPACQDQGRALGMWARIGVV